MGEGLAFISNLKKNTTQLFLSVLSTAVCISHIHACIVRVVVVEHGPLGICTKKKSWTSLSALLAFCSIPCERG